MEYIKNIEIKNFKSIRHQTIDDCRRINVFIGYPNVGKSNILEALGLYSLLQLGYESFDLNQICRIKYPAEIFFNQNVKDSIQITINQGISLKIEWGFNSDLKAEIELLSDHDFNQDRTSILRVAVDRNNRFGGATNSVMKSSYDHIMIPVKKYDFIKGTQTNNRGYSLNVPNGDNLLEVLQSSAKLRVQLKNILDSYDLRLFLDKVDQSIKFFKELKDGTAIAIPYHQIADTLQRLIFYISAIETNEETALLFEEPESHMFPPYISKLTSDIIYDENRNQYFITTHSPFVLNDFMEDVDKEELSVYVVGYKKETGETIVRRITDEEKEEIYQYGVDLFFNLENYLKDAV